MSLIVVVLLPFLCGWLCFVAILSTFATFSFLRSVYRRAAAKGIEL
ncbi:MAG: hypothetical protein K6B46_00615 [Opitutales bacterium]|nr:hypothetical protein [Opitutales bacterium]